MAKNRIWVIEIKIGEIWSLLLDSSHGIPRVHYTRAKARVAMPRYTKNSEMISLW